MNTVHYPMKLVSTEPLEIVSGIFEHCTIQLPYLQDGFRGQIELVKINERPSTIVGNDYLICDYQHVAKENWTFQSNKGYHPSCVTE